MSKHYDRINDPKKKQEPAKDTTPDNNTPAETPVLATEKQPPKYIIARKTGGYVIRAGRGGQVPESMQGLFTTHENASWAIHLYECQRSSRYAGDPSKHVVT